MRNQCCEPPEERMSGRRTDALQDDIDRWGNPALVEGIARRVEQDQAAAGVTPRRRHPSWKAASG